MNPSAFSYHRLSGPFNLVRALFIIFFLVHFQTGFSQDSTSKIFVNEVNWTIAIPENFEIVDDSVQNNLNKKGAKLLGEANKVAINISTTKTLFSVHNGRNMLYATITPFSEKKDGSYAKSNSSVKEMLYKTFVEKIPNAQVDSSTSDITIDKLNFEKFTVKIILNHTPLITMSTIYRLRKGYDFSISYLYMNDWAQKAIEKVIFESKFGD